MSAAAADYHFEGYRRALGEDFFADDPELQAVLRHHGMRDEAAWKRLAAYGRFAASSASAGADEADRPETLPRLAPWTPWNEQDPVGVEVHPATRRVLAASLRAGAATEPNVWLRYAMAYLGAEVGEAGVTCPLACTDGLVRAIQELEHGPEAKAALDHVLLQAPGAPVHGAQFVTEVQGGSDAATNAVRAVAQANGSFRLYGRKWFCSNPWAQYWAVTARPEGAPEGPRGVALFVVPREQPAGRANGFRLERLKDKLGTRALPTAEMGLDGAVAWPLGSPNAGLSNMVRIVLTTSRFWNALAAASMARGAERVALAYARFRTAFGRRLDEFPLVADTLDTLSRDRRGLLAAAFEVLAAWEKTAAAERAGREPNADDAVRSRVLVMLAKTCATRRGTQRVHDAMMILAGNGIEERFSPLPRLWRDAAIMETWEGPHGLLLARSLLDIGRFGAAGDPAGFVKLLLGEGAGQPGGDAASDSLGGRLSGILADRDERRQAVAFRDWATEFYDAFGALCWSAAQAS
jgi:alkylation response protein AidB-like acyl-CoA dehydrogenase